MISFEHTELGEFLSIIPPRHVACQNCYLPYSSLASILHAPRLNRLLLVDCEFSSASTGHLSEIPEALPLSIVSFERSRIDRT